MWHSVACLDLSAHVVVHGELNQQTALNLRQQVLVQLQSVLQHIDIVGDQFSNDGLAYLWQCPVLQ